MFPHQTTYAYADNNPIRFIDLLGMNSQDSNKNDEDEEEKKKNQKTSQSDYTISVYGNSRSDVRAAKAKYGSQGTAESGANNSSEVAANGEAEKGLPSIDGQTGPWSIEYVAEKAFEILSHPSVGTTADLMDWLQFTKGAGNFVTLMVLASDSYQRFYKGGINDMIYGYRLTTTGVAHWAGITVGPIGGLTVGLYATGIEKAAETGAKAEGQMRNYLNPKTKGNFWNKFYW